MNECLRSTNKKNLIQSRQIRQARRNGPLRYIIPHPDDLPPPYSNYGPAEATAAQANDGQREGNGNLAIGKFRLPL